MQTSPGVAALLNPFAAPQGAGLASGQPSGLGGLLEGLFSDAGQDAGAKEGEFGQALDAALAAALGAPLPAQPLQQTPAPKAEGGDIDAGDASNSGPQQALSPTLAFALADKTTAVVQVATPDTLESETAPQIMDAVEPQPAAPAEPRLSTTMAKPVEGQPTAQSAPTPADIGFRSPSTKLADIPATPTPAAAAVATEPPQADPPLADARPVQTTAAAPAAMATASAEAARATTQNAKAAAPAQADPVKSAKVKSGDLDAPARHAADTDQAAPAAAASVELAEAVEAAPRAGGQSGADPDADQPAPEQPTFAGALHGTSEHRAVQSAPTETPRATPHTVAHLAAQIANKVEGKATRFDVQLDPHGLGKVDVRVEIGARGDISAALTFENPQAAAELRGRANELQTALEQAGFDLSKTSLSFSSGGQGQHQGLFDQQQQASTPTWRGRAFADLSDTPETAPAPVRRRAETGGVDVRI